jgi:glycosyltransferase involved in cell wall biosynthesis
MKILYLNGADVEGGAARAATLMLRGVRSLEVDAQLHVQRKSGNDPLVYGPRTLAGRIAARLRPTVEQLLLGIGPGKTNGPFCAAFLPDRLPGLVAATGPDIVHLHWVARMMQIETLAHFKVPIVWTLHDSWPFTGGCYLPGDCTRYQASCGSCPVLGSSREDDLSRRVWQRKDASWENLNLTLVAPSRWMAACAQASSLFRDRRIEVIPNGIDLDRFKPVDRRIARERLSLPLDRKLILFGAKGATSDRNKGFHLLTEALHELTAGITRESSELVVFGTASTDTFADLGLKVHYLGWQDDDEHLAQIYAAADVFVLPSIQESLGYTVMEAMACGTPCVAFDQGGVPDIIDHGQNGYLAHPFVPEDLAQGIAHVLEDSDSRELWSIRARQKIEDECALEKVAARHLALYQTLGAT